MSPQWVDATSVLVRGLSFIAQLQLAGIAIFIALFDNQLIQSRSSITALGRHSASAAFCLVVLHHLLEAARMSGDFSGVLDPSLQLIALHSAIAVANALRLIAIVIIVASIQCRSNSRYVVLMVGIVLLGLAFTMVGHTAVNPLRWLLAPLLWLHIVIAAFWFGALLPLCMVATHETPALAGRIVQTFSTRAAWSVPLIGVAGLLMAWILLPTFSALLEPYGELLLFKLMSFIALMGLAALNKWRLGPAIAQGEANVVIAFRRSVLVEYAVICAVLCATATMTSLFSPE